MERKNTLYEQSFEHDNCGIGAVVNIDGSQSRKIVDNALSIVEKLEHRAGKDASGETGDEVLVLKDSFFTVSNPESTMTVGPAFGTHHFTEGKEDSEAKTPGAATVYLTDYTAFHHVITIRP